MRNLIIGDVHGHFNNLRDFLLSQGAINEQNERINKDTLGVYCTGDLVDGGVNRLGDMLILEHAAEWFDAIVIGNHELPFFGGVGFLGLRKHDREFQRALLNLEAAGKYVPSIVVGDFLLTHAGLADRWGFDTPKDADHVIRMFWHQSTEQSKEVPILDWVGPARTKQADPTGGVFWLDWTEQRNTKFNQVVGHSTYTNGPIMTTYDDGVEHWNIDVGGKYGSSLGGIIIEDGKPTVPVFWGERIVLKSYGESSYLYSAGSADEMSAADAAEWDALDAAADEDELDWSDAIDLDDPENYTLWQELMETNGI
jgi:hypothetical protein